MSKIGVNMKKRYSDDLDYFIKKLQFKHINLFENHLEKAFIEAREDEDNYLKTRGV